MKNEEQLWPAYLFFDENPSITYTITFFSREESLCLDSENYYIIYK